VDTGVGMGGSDIPTSHHPATPAAQLGQSPDAGNVVEVTGDAEYSEKSRPSPVFNPLNPDPALNAGFW